MSETPEELNAEIERLRAERDQLRNEAGHEPRRSRTRSVGVVLFVVLSLLSLAAAVPGTWGRRTMLVTDRYVETVAPMASDPAIQEALARRITEETFAALDVEERLATLVADRAPRLVFIVGPVVGGLRGFIHDQVLKLIESDAFANYWVKANRVVHEQAMAALRGEDGILETEGGQVTLNYLPLVNETLRGLGSAVSDLIGREVSLPEITPETVASDAILRLEEATGLDLPETFGTVVVYDSEELAVAQQAFRLVNRGVFLLVFLFLAFAALALWLSPRRRRTLLQLAVGGAVILVIERRLAIAGANEVVAQVAEQSQPAARSIVDLLLTSLLGYTGWLLALFLAVGFAAWLTGPYRWAVAVRRGATSLARGATGMARGEAEGDVVSWIADHRDVAMLGVALAGLLVLLLFDLSFWWSMLVAAAIAAAELLIWRSAQGQAATAEG